MALKRIKGTSLKKPKGKVVSVGKKRPVCKVPNKSGMRTQMPMYTQGKG